MTSGAPVAIRENGEWEIRRQDAVVAYGVWRLEGKRFIWTYKDGDEYRDDVIPVLSVAPDRIEMREADGAVTVFVRVSK